MSSSCFSSKVSHWVFSWVTCWLNLSDPLPCILPLHLACPRVHEECQCPPAAHWHSRRGWTMNEKAAALRCIHKWRSHISWMCGGEYLTWFSLHFKQLTWLLGDLNLPSHLWPPDPPECWMSHFDLLQILSNLSSPDFFGDEYYEAKLTLYLDRDYFYA